MPSMRCPAVYLVLQEVGLLWLASSLRGNRSTMPLAMSAFPPKADMDRRGCDVRFVPIADIAIDHLVGLCERSRHRPSTLAGKQKIQHSIGVCLRRLDVGEMRSIEHGERGAGNAALDVFACLQRSRRIVPTDDQCRH